MPKVIKKRPAKKKIAREPEVKNFAMKTLDEIKKRQKQAVIGVSVIAAVALIIIIFFMYSSYQSREAYALEMEANNIYYSTDAGGSLSVEERTKKALDLYRASTDIKVTPTALYYLGNSYFILGDFENAIKEYDRFVRKFSREKEILPLVYQKMASAYFKSDQDEKALDTLGRLAKVDDGIYQDTALMFEARYYDSKGKTEKALEKYRIIAGEFPVSPWSIEANTRISAAEAKETEGASTGETGISTDSTSEAEKSPEGQQQAVPEEK